MYPDLTDNLWSLILIISHFLLQGLYYLMFQFLGPHLAQGYSFKRPSSLDTVYLKVHSILTIYVATCNFLFSPPSTDVPIGPLPAHTIWMAKCLPAHRFYVLNVLSVLIVWLGCVLCCLWNAILALKILSKVQHFPNEVFVLCIFL